MVYQFKKSLDEVEELKIDGPMEFLIIDEYQDLNRCDLKTIKILNSKGAKLLVAGDDDQSIYGFRFAYPEGIRNFCDEIKNSEQFTITECHRCDKKILTLAMNIIKQDFRRLPKTIKSITEKDGSVNLLRFQDQETEANKISEIITQLKHDKKFEDNDFLILLRTDFNNAFSKIIIEALEKHSISINKDFQYSIFDSPSGRLFIGIVKYFKNNQNDLAIRSILSAARGIGESFIDSIYNYAKKNNVRFHEVIQNVIGGDITDIKNSDKIKKIMDPITKLTTQIKETDKTFTDKINNNLALIYNDEFSGAIRDLIINNKIESIDDLIFFITDLLGVVEPVEENLPGVRLMTMHKAKGLTAKVVFIVALEDEYIPGKGEVDEERRLLYVSLTRAKHYLFMTFCNKRTGQQQNLGFLKHKTQYRNLSRFITDIPDINIIDGTKY